MSITVTAARRTVTAARILSQLRGSRPTPAQRKQLAAFPGWGPAAGLFDTQPAGSWAALADDLDETIDSTEVRAAGRVVDTSFFTPPVLIEHIYALLRHAGFAGGTVLDLGCGSGRFLEHAPRDWHLDYTGVEADPISARIAAVLHPSATIIGRELQKVTLPRSFDIAVGNVPFSSSNVHDSSIAFYGSLHEYFLTRAVQAVRPGGYVVVVTSRHTLDSKHGLCHFVREHADMLVAIRLPSGYFRAEGTDVVADVLVLRVRSDDRDEGSRVGWHPGHSPTIALSEVINARYCSTPVSTYWGQHPQLVAGQMRLTGYQQSPLAVDADDPEVAVSDAFAAAEQKVALYPLPMPAGATDFSDVELADPEGRKESSLHVVDGRVVRVVDAALVPVARAGAELRALIELRDEALELLAAESDWNRPDEQLQPQRQRCHRLYSQYVSRYGPLNRGTVVEGPVDPETGTAKLRWKAPGLGGFRSDPDCAIVLALELYDQDCGRAEPAPILVRRVNRRPQPVRRAATAAQALAVCLGEGRGLDLDRISGLLGLGDPNEAFRALGDLVYRDPLTGAAVTARDYLCGDVRLKLREALTAAAQDAAFERNVAALQEIQPTWLTRHDIRIELGSPWVTAGDVRDFCAEVFQCRVDVEHVAPLAAWEVTGNAHAISDQAKIAYCTQRMTALRLLEIGLNGAAPVVYDEFYDAVSRTTRRVRNSEDTDAAEQKLAAIADAFSLWVWRSPDREQRIVDRYNEVMNARVLRRHDGSHLTFPGLADGVQLWPWQRDFVDQAVSSPAAFAAHEVGLGKTLTAITLAMTLRQFALANRPAYVVPNHLIEQASRLCYQSFPAGRFLIVSREDLHGAARRRFAARCATGDWDLVVMTHEAFSAIPVPEHVEQDWIQDQLVGLEGYTRTQGYAAKAVARAVRSLKGRIERLRHRVNDPAALTFDMLGIDHLGIDEADRFRRLPVTTRTEGFSLGSSKRATDLLLKLSMLRRARPGKPYAALYSGTPWTNTLAEAYVWQRLLAPQQLDQTGLSHFDAWSAQFVRFESIVEVAPDGSGFRSKRRPAVIQNVPELRSMLSEFMTIVRAETTGLQRPTAQRHILAVDPSESTTDFMDSLVVRADLLRRRSVPLDQDNMLLICGDGRKVALDPNLVGIAERAPKLDAVAREVADIYHRTKHIRYPESVIPGAFQLVLCDLGTPKTGDSQSYGRIRSGLIARGVPAAKVRFVHEATTPKAREALFAGCRSGEVAVLIGSTQKVGIGTNVQARLVALHHVDPTWTAAAWEQRNGRAIRTGNHHSFVWIYSYVCRNTFDAYMFGVVERKSRGFEQLSRVDSQVREIEDLGGDGTLSFAELKAAAAGNALLLRQHELATRIRKLRLAHVTVQQNVHAMYSRAHQAEAAAETLQRRAERLAGLSEHRASFIWG